METIITVPFGGRIHHLLFLLQFSVTVLMYLAVLLSVIFQRTFSTSGVI